MKNSGYHLILGVMAMKRADQYDLTIIGGGIVGAWALYLATVRHPDWRSVLIERSRIGGGATFHSAGVVLATGRTPWQRELAARSSALYAEVGEALQLVTSRITAHWILDEASVERVQSSLVGFALTVPEPGARESLQRILPTLRLGPSETLLSGGTAMRYDAADTARALVARCWQVPGISCWEGVQVGTVLPSREDVELTLDDGTSLIASRAIVATGPWVLGGPGKVVAREAGVRIKKVVALHIDLVPGPGAPALFFPDSDAYLMPLPRRQQWLFSFASQEWDCQPRDKTLRITSRDREVAASILDRYVPGLISASRGGRVFCDAYAPEGVPLVARPPETAALVVAGAGGGSGVRLGPGIAEKAIEMLA